MTQEEEQREEQKKKNKMKEGSYNGTRIIKISSTAEKKK